MKVKPDDYEQLMVAVKAVLARYPAVNASCIDGNLTAMRYRWGLLHCAIRRGLHPGLRELYRYCDDRHIDTALRKITKTK